MIHNYFQVIHITIEKIIIGNTQSAHDVPGTFLEGSLKVSSGDSQGTNTKFDDFMKKLFFRSNSSCITYLFLFFTGKKKIQKF